MAAMSEGKLTVVTRVEETGTLQTVWSLSGKSWTRGSLACASEMMIGNVAINLLVSRFIFEVLDGSRETAVFDHVWVAQHFQLERERHRLAKSAFLKDAAPENLTRIVTQTFQRTPVALVRGCGPGASGRMFSCITLPRPCVRASAKQSECPHRSRCR